MKHIKSLLILLALAFCIIQTNNLFAGEKTYGDHSAVIKTLAHDGDTLTVDVPGVDSLLGDAIPIRLDGYDTPELRDKDPEIRNLAELARDYVRSLLPPGTRVTLKNCKRGKYFRIVAGVQFLERDHMVDLGERLFVRGLATPYAGGTKPDWRRILNARASAT
jgi:micrococcal nuclease